MDTRITVRLDAETRAILEMRAKSQDIKLSELVRQILTTSTLSDKIPIKLSDKQTKVSKLSDKPQQKKPASQRKWQPYGKDKAVK